MKHIKESGEIGAPLAELQQVLPSLSKDQVQTLLKELKAEERVFIEGKTKGSRWHIKRN